MQMVLRIKKRERVYKRYRRWARTLVRYERRLIVQGAQARFKYNSMYQLNRKYRDQLWHEYFDYLSYYLLMNRPSDTVYAKAGTKSFRFVVVCLFLVLFLLYVIYLQTLSTIVVGLV